MSGWMVVVILGILFMGAGGVVMAVGVHRRTRAYRAAMGGDEKIQIPVSPLQKRALSTLVITFAAMAVLAWMFRHGNLAGAFLDDSFRHRVAGILVATFLINLSFRIPLNKQGLQGLLLDERDQKIHLGAARTQLSLVLATVALWTLGLTEAYRENQLVPVDGLTLLFWSTLLMYFMGWALGVLLGYWRLNRYGR